MGHGGVKVQSMTRKEGVCVCDGQRGKSRGWAGAGRLEVGGRGGGGDITRRQGQESSVPESSSS